MTKGCILARKVFADEMREDFSVEDRMRLNAAIRDGERCLKTAWQKPATAQRVTRRKKAEIDHVLSGIVTKEAASKELYRACFPDRMLSEKLEKLDPGAHERS